METLLSGLIGAFIATFLSIFYHFIFEQKKTCSEIMLDVVMHLDEIYTKIQTIQVEKDSRFKNREGLLTIEEYNRVNVRLRDLINTHKIAVKIEIMYGRGSLVAQFNRLKAFLMEAAMSVWEGRESDWKDNNRYVNRLFTKKIDPSRKSFESLLIKKCKAVEIVKDFYWPNKLAQGTAHNLRRP
jgi:hypothetical protein